MLVMGKLFGHVCILPIKLLLVCTLDSDLDAWTSVVGAVKSNISWPSGALMSLRQLLTKLSCGYKQSHRKPVAHFEV